MEWDLWNHLIYCSSFRVKASVEITHVLEAWALKNFGLAEVVGDAHLVDALSCGWVKDVNVSVVDEVHTISLLIVLIFIFLV